MVNFINIFITNILCYLQHLELLFCVLKMRIFISVNLFYWSPSELHHPILFIATCSNSHFISTISFEFTKLTIRHIRFSSTNKQWGFYFGTKYIWVDQKFVGGDFSSRIYIMVIQPGKLDWPCFHCHGVKFILVVWWIDRTKVWYLILNLI